MTGTAPTLLSPVVFGAVLGAAAMHAGWNAVLKIRLQPLLGMGLIATACALIACLALPVTGWPVAAAWPWIVASVILHLAYYVCLAEAYRRADLSQMYPIARGAAPLLTAVVSVALLHERMAALPTVGIVTLAAGVVLMSLKGGRHARRDLVASAFALATAATISAYTLVDGIGARTAGDPNAYAAALFAVDGVPILALVLWLYGREGLRKAARFAGPGFAGGALSLAAYWIVIWAMTVAPIPLVAALRETSVLFGALIAVVILHEPVGRYRIASAALILGGIALIRLG